ncbi:uncharacterized protein [Eurosta solidaginis]|uniref:uncharacterized protein n=1 Tax=Eurosta solidaginis TaxID=178769 RepID=UPI0035312163
MARLPVTHKMVKYESQKDISLRIIMQYENDGWPNNIEFLNCKEKWRIYRNATVRSLKEGKRYYLHEHTKFVLKYVKPFKVLKDLDIKEDIPYTRIDQIEDTKDHFEDTKDHFEEVYTTDNIFDPLVETPDKREMPKAKKNKRKTKADNKRYIADTVHQSKNQKEMFFLSLMPDVEKLTDENFLQFRINTIIDLQNFLINQSQTITDVNQDSS